MRSFPGLMPSDMQKLHPDLWLNDTDEAERTCTKRISASANEAFRLRL